MKQTLLILLFISGTTLAYAQGAKNAAPAPQTDTTSVGLSYTDPNRLTAADYIHMQLPPLHELLESVRANSPQVQMYTATREMEERELKTIRRNWLQYIKLNSTFSYGNTDSNSSLYYDQKYPVIQNVSNMTQRWWSVGASLTMPLSEIFNRHNRNLQQKKRIESITYEQAKWYDEVCLKVIDSYTAAIENLSILESASKAMETAKAQYLSTEADFINGQADPQTLSRQKNIENVAVREYEQARSLLIKSLLELEVLTKVPIVNKVPLGQ